MEDNFRDVILASLVQRNSVNYPISQNKLARVFDNYANISDKLAILKSQIRDGSNRRESKSDDATVEALQTQLNDVIRQKEKNDQRLIETNERLQDKEKSLILSNRELSTLKCESTEMRAAFETMKSRMASLQDDNSHLRDEYLALQTTFTMIDEKYRKSVDENNELRERWMALKKTEADVMNAENELQMKRQSDNLRHEIDRASEKIVNVPVFDETNFELVEDDYKCAHIGCYAPSRCKFKFEPHDSDVNAVCWSISGTVFATGGVDRKVKVWTIVNGQATLKATLTGCNQAVTSLDFSSDDKHVLASCNDYAARIWTWQDQRCRSTLTGHSDKIVSAKFRMGGTGVITGSHDSTIKLWDVRTVRCLRTLFARSRCNAVVSSEDSGSSIISGHHDKKLRFWDSNSNEPHNEICVDARVTSLDLSTDGMYVLCSTREDCLKLIDLRTNSVIHTYCAENYRVSCDFARCVLSPDMSFCVAGSADGHVFIWDVNTTKIEKELNKGHESAVMACAWQPTGYGLLSCEKHKSVCYWSDY